VPDESAHGSLACSSGAGRRGKGRAGGGVWRGGFEVFVERLMRMGGFKKVWRASREFGWLGMLEESSWFTFFLIVLLVYLGLDMFVSVDQHPCVLLVLKATPGNRFFFTALSKSV
jgi:hypothetical protein